MNFWNTQVETSIRGTIHNLFLTIVSGANPLPVSGPGMGEVLSSRLDKGYMIERLLHTA